MKRHTKMLLGAVLLNFVITAAPLAQQADSYPNKAIKIVVPFPPGGSTDALARLVGEQVGADLGQPVIVENRPGASGAIAADYVAKSEADGYTVFLGSSPVLAVNPSLYSKLPYDPLNDFDPVILAAMLPNVVVVPSSSSVKTMQELIALAKQSHPPLNYGSSVPGSPSHLGVEMLKHMTDIQAQQIPYKGGMPALTDLVGGETGFMIAILPEAMPFVDSGKLNVLAVTTAKRLAAYPDLPTVSESGVPDYELIAWYGFVVPTGTPAEIVSKLNSAFNSALEHQKIRKKLIEMSFEVEGGEPEKLNQLMRSEAKKWAKVVKRANISLD